MKPKRLGNVFHSYGVTLIVVHHYPSSSLLHILHVCVCLFLYTFPNNTHTRTCSFLGIFVILQLFLYLLGDYLQAELLRLEDDDDDVIVMDFY